MFVVYYYFPLYSLCSDLLSQYDKCCEKMLLNFSPHERKWTFSGPLCMHVSVLYFSNQEAGYITDCLSTFVAPTGLRLSTVVGYMILSFARFGISSGVCEPYHRSHTTQRVAYSRKRGLVRVTTVPLVVCCYGKTSLWNRKWQAVRKRAGRQCSCREKQFGATSSVWARSTLPWCGHVQENEHSGSTSGSDGKSGSGLLVVFLQLRDAASLIGSVWWVCGCLHMFRVVLL